MKLPCCIVQDLLPIYMEKMTSVPSDELIEEHLADCGKCAAALERMKAEENSGNRVPGKSTSLERVRNDIKKRKRRFSILISLIVFLAAFTVFSYLTRPIYISYQDSGAAVAETGAQELYVRFSDQVTSCKVSTFYEDGRILREVEAWTSVWDRILGNTTPYALLSSDGKKTDTVYYCDETKEQDNMVVLYGTTADTNAAITALPRLFLGYYFVAAGMAAALAGLIWFLLRKKKKASTICRCLFFIPASYLLGNLLLSTSFVSYSAPRDFLMNLIASAAIFGICILSSALIKQHKADRA